MASSSPRRGCDTQPDLLPRRARRPPSPAPPRAHAACRAHTHVAPCRPPAGQPRGEPGGDRARARAQHRVAARGGGLRDRGARLVREAAARRDAVRARSCVTLSLSPRAGRHCYTQRGSHRSRCPPPQHGTARHTGGRRGTVPQCPRPTAHPALLLLARVKTRRSHASAACLFGISSGSRRSTSRACPYRRSRSRTRSCSSRWRTAASTAWASRASCPSSRPAKTAAARSPAPPRLPARAARCRLSLRPRWASACSSTPRFCRARRRVRPVSRPVPLGRQNQNRAFAGHDLLVGDVG